MRFMLTLFQQVPSMCRGSRFGDPRRDLQFLPEFEAEGLNDLKSRFWGKTGPAAHSLEAAFGPMRNGEGHNWTLSQDRV